MIPRRIGARCTALAVLAVATGVAAGVAGPGVAGARTAIGSVVSGRIEIAGKQIPLPPGPFTVIAAGSTQARAMTGGRMVGRLDLGPIGTVTLAQVVDGRLTMVVEAAANLIPTRDGWGTAADCRRTDLYAAVTRYQSGWDVSCLYLKPSAPPAGEAATRRSAASAGFATDFWLVAGLRIADRHDVVDVRYIVDPIVLGVPGSAYAAAAWDPATIQNHPTQLTAVKELAAWAAVMADPLEHGLRGRLPETASPAIPQAATSDAADLERRATIAALQGLRDTGAISTPEFERQVTSVTAAAAAASGGRTHTRLADVGWAGLTYGAVTGALSGGIGYLFIGRPYTAGVLAVLQVVLGSTTYFFHDMLWQEAFGLGPSRRDGPAVIEFGSIGDRPAD